MITGLCDAWLCRKDWVCSGGICTRSMLRLFKDCVVPVRDSRRSHRRCYVTASVHAGARLQQSRLCLRCNALSCVLVGLRRMCPASTDSDRACVHAPADKYLAAVWGTTDCCESKADADASLSSPGNSRDHQPSLPGQHLYLKDWHCIRDRPHYPFYRVPGVFADDWLNWYT